MKTLKVVLLGSLGVGKTCLRLQFVHHVFSNAYKATIGGDYLTLTVNLPHSNHNNNNNIIATTHSSEPSSTPPQEPSISNEAVPTSVTLQIWDTAGQERFNLISQAFYRGTDICVLVYDVTNYELLVALNDWFARFIKHCHVENPGVLVVGSKADKPRAVQTDEVLDILDRNAVEGAPRVADYLLNRDLDVVETLSKKLAQVAPVFQRVAEIGTMLELQIDDTPRLVSLELDTVPQKRSCCF